MSDYEHYGDTQQSSAVPERGGAGNAVKFLLIGAGIGAAVALLVTPMSGRECRETTRKGYRNALDSISEQTRNLRERGSNLLRFGRKKA